jgi:hypothetical protein
MKTFKQVLNEFIKDKTYVFKMGFAGEIPENFADTLETALHKYDVLKISPPKKTPIQERPLDFPNLQNMEVTYYQVELAYPTTTQIMHEYLKKFCNLPSTHIVVRNINEPLEAYQDGTGAKEEVYEPLITKTDMGGISDQQNVGQNRVMDLLKELEIARKENPSDAHDFAFVGNKK